MTSVLPGCTEPSFVVTPIHHTSSNETGLSPFLATKPEEAAMDSNSFVYYNNRGESIVDFTLELEIVRNCLGKIALQRRTFERRASIDSINTNSSIVEDDSDVEDSAPMERRVLPTNVSFLLKELDGCLDNMKKCREHRNKKGNDKEPNNASKERVVDREIEVKSRNLWISQENIAKVSARFATSFKSAISDSIPNSTTATSKLHNYAQRQPVTLSEVYIAALWAGWVSKYYVVNHLFVPRKTWKRRFFVLTPKALYRFKSSAPSAVSLEPIEISGKTTASVCEKFPGRRWVIEINNLDRPTCHIQVESLEELKIWLSSIKSAIIQSKYPFCRSTSKVSRTRGNARDSIATSSTASSGSSGHLNRGMTRSTDIDMTRLPTPTPMPKYPPPSIPNEECKVESSLQRMPSFNSAEHSSCRGPLQRMNTLPGKGPYQASESTNSKLLILEPNPTLLINAIPQNNLTFSAVEATH